MRNISQTSTVDLFDLHYFRQRQRNNFYDAVISRFVALAKTEGLTKKQLAQRLGKSPAQITKLLKGSTNMQMDTISDLLLAMGAEIRPEVVSIDSGETIDVPRLTKPSETGAELAELEAKVMAAYELDFDDGVEYGEAQDDWVRSVSCSKTSEQVWEALAKCGEVE